MSNSKEPIEIHFTDVNEESETLGEEAVMDQRRRSSVDSENWDSSPEQDSPVHRLERLKSDSSIILSSLNTRQIARMRWRKAMVALALKNGSAKVSFASKSDRYIEALEDIKHFRNQETPRWYILLPDGAFRVGWDVTQAIMLCFLAIVVPIRVGFNVTAYGVLKWIETSVEFFFVADIFCNFVTAFYKPEDGHDVLVCQPALIAINYLKGWFLLDFVAVLPMQIVIDSLEQDIECSYSVTGCPSLDTMSDSVFAPSPPPVGTFAPPSPLMMLAREEEDVNDVQLLKLLKMVRFLRLVKLLRLAQINSILARYRERMIYMEQWSNIIKMAFTTIVVSHFLACLYAGMYQFTTTTLSSKYVTMVYWAVQTITTVGYGDVQMEDDVSGQIISVLTMLLGGFIFSWIISNMTSMLNPDSSQNRFKARMSFVLDFMKSNSIPIHVAAKFLKFYEKQNMNALNDKMMINGLPYLMKAELFENMYRHYLIDMPFFQDTNRAFVNAVCMHLDELIVPAGRFLYTKGELAEDMFFVTKGLGAIILDDKVIEGQAFDPDGAEGSDQYMTSCKSFRMDDGKSAKKAKKKKRTIRLSKFVPRDLPSRHMSSRKSVDDDEKRKDKVDRTRIVNMLKAKDLCGESALLGVMQRPYSVIAIHDFHLLSLSRVSWAYLIKILPEMHDRLTLTFLERLARLHLFEKDEEMLENNLETLGLLHLMNLETGMLRSDWKALFMELPEPATPAMSVIAPPEDFVSEHKSLDYVSEIKERRKSTLTDPSDQFDQSSAPARAPPPPPVNIVRSSPQRTQLSPASSRSSNLSSKRSSFAFSTRAPLDPAEIELLSQESGQNGDLSDQVLVEFASELQMRNLNPDRLSKSSKSFKSPSHLRKRSVTFREVVKERVGGQDVGFTALQAAATQATDRLEQETSSTTTTSSHAANIAHYPPEAPSLLRPLSLQIPKSVNFSDSDGDLSSVDVAMREPEVGDGDWGVDEGAKEGDAECRGGGVAGYEDSPAYENPTFHGKEQIVVYHDPRVDQLSEQVENLTDQMKKVVQMVSQLVEHTSESRTPSTFASEMVRQSSMRRLKQDTAIRYRSTDSSWAKVQSSLSAMRRRAKQGHKMLHVPVKEGEQQDLRAMRRNTLTNLPSPNEDGGQLSTKSI